MGTELLNKTMPGENIPFRIKDGGEATSHSSTHAAQFSRQAEETEFRKSKRSQPLSAPLPPRMLSSSLSSPEPSSRQENKGVSSKQEPS